MNRDLAETAADLAVIAIVVWFLVAERFDAMPSRSALNLVGYLVIATSVMRLWRRSRKDDE
ncbi:hypothetical protein SAMN05444004_10851 [Jannaschia faecimaris]|uniref:Uncharacterized protein n=1 Tax=Jannaschia faecimaris TaxID=1244108 RepID=A0A1H3RBM7_9RHOB|nr:hypothetical protein [Jannaschia faecimaris]SDZ23154.1 hypothetical protein SAMN05444004_10851 [Jannaschia faecimaris]